MEKMPRFEKASDFLSIVVVGFPFHGLSVEDVCDFDIFILVPEPENEIDPKAVRVFGEDIDKKRHLLGYVAKSCHRELEKHPPIEQEARYTAISAWGDSPRAVSLVLSRESPRPTNLSA